MDRAEEAGKRVAMLVRAAAALDEGRAVVVVVPTYAMGSGVRRLARTLDARLGERIRIVTTANGLRGIARDAEILIDPTWEQHAPEAERDAVASSMTAIQATGR